MRFPPVIDKVLLLLRRPLLGDPRVSINVVGHSALLTRSQELVELAEVDEIVAFIIDALIRALDDVFVQLNGLSPPVTRWCTHVSN